MRAGQWLYVDTGDGGIFILSSREGGRGRRWMTGSEGDRTRGPSQPSGRVQTNRDRASRYMSDS